MKKGGGLAFRLIPEVISSAVGVDDGTMPSRFSTSVARHFHQIPWPPLAFRSDSNGGGSGGDEEVNTNLSLIPSQMILNPTPLKWYCPQQTHFDGLDSSTSTDTSAIAPNPGGKTVKKSREPTKKRRRRSDGGDQSQRKRISKTSRSSNAGEDENQRPLIPIEEIQGLFGTLLSRKGTTPVFLYRKKLEKSDVLRDQNRLFVNKREKMMEFLREEEAAAVVGDGKGLKVVGIDGAGNVYDTVGLKEWRSLKKMAINSDWSKVVAKNNAEKGDVVEIWGYRENEKACLAFNFRREREREREIEEDERMLQMLAAAAIMFDEEQRNIN